MDPRSETQGWLTDPPSASYHRVRSSAAEMNVGFAPVRLERHRDGMSCQNPAAYTYDANGRKRWCIDCGAELGEQSWHPDGADVHPRISALALVLAMVLVLCLAGLYLVTGGISAGPPVPSHTPTTYGPPPTVVP